MGSSANDRYIKTDDLTGHPVHLPSAAGPAQDSKGNAVAETNQVMLRHQFQRPRKRRHQEDAGNSQGAPHKMPRRVIKGEDDDIITTAAVCVVKREMSEASETPLVVYGEEPIAGKGEDEVDYSEEGGPRGGRRTRTRDVSRERRRRSRI